MPTINLSGSNPNDPKQSRGAAFDAYEKAQSEASRKSSDVNSAFDAVQKDAASQMEGLWSSYAAQLKSQMSQQNAAFRKEMQARAQYLSAERARESERSRHAKAIQGVQKAVERAERNRYSGARLDANAENSNRNYRDSGTRANANAENSNRNYAASGMWANANAENRNRDAVAKSIERNKQKQFSEDYTLAMRENADRDKVSKLEEKVRKDRGKDEDKRFKEDYTLAMRENADRDRIARVNAAARARETKDYRTENVDRLGVYGMRSAERNDWRGLHRSERELDQIQRKFGQQPGIAAALARARGRINAGSEGNPSWMMSLGRMGGAIEEMGLLEGGGYALGGAAGGAAGLAAYAAFKGGKAVLDTPMTISNYVNSMVGKARPYMDMRTGLSNMGRVSGVNSRDLEAQFSGSPAWMRRYGLSAPDSADLLGQYGIAPYSVGQGAGAVRSIAGAAYDMGVDPSGVARSVGSASNLGMTNQLNVDQYLRKLRQVTEVAVSQGMNRSQATEVLEGLYKQATTANTATLGSGSGLADMWSRMMQAGTTSARSGASASSMLAGASTFANDIGFNTQNPARAQAMASYIQRNGGTKAFAADGDAAIQKLIGKDAYDNLVQTPGGIETLRRAREAAKLGDMGLLMNNLSPIVDGNPDSVQRVINGSSFGDNKTPYGELGRQTLSGATPQAYNDYNVTKSVSVGSATGAEGHKMYDTLIKQGWSPKAAADMVANAYIESGFDPKAENKSHHYGIFQLDVARQKLFREHMGFDIHGSSVAQQLDFNNWELNNTEKKTGDIFRSGNDLGPGVSVFSLTDERPGMTDQEKQDEANRRGDLRDKIMGPLAAGDSNSNADVNSVKSRGGDLATQASKTEFDRVKAGDDALGATLLNISTGAEKLNASFFQLAAATTNLISVMGRAGGGGAGGQGGKGLYWPSLNPFGSSTPYDLTPLRKG